MDVSTLKADIKAWERSFKSKNARDPTIQDIKLQPEIADKYRLYKKLSKNINASGPSTSAHNGSEPPATPTRSRPRSHQPLPTLLTQPRAIETTAPLTSFNPFSPRKDKGKQRESAVKLRTKSSSSPFKSKAPAVDPFPLLDLSKLAPRSATPPHSPPAAAGALSRARKRLRGEPVSPSPNKGKRRRIGSQTTLPFMRLVPDSSSSEDEEERDPNSTFISASPVKAPAGVKSFKLLFDEACGSKSAALTTGKSSLPRTRTKSTGRGLFGSKSAGGVDDDPEWDLGSVENLVEKGKHKAEPSKFTAPPTNGPPRIANGKAISSAAKNRNSVKRTLSDTEEPEDSATPPPSTGPSLLPPSPPPADSSTYRSKQFANAKGKGKAVPGGRKKAKTLTDDNVEEDEYDDSDTLLTSVKIVDRMRSHPTRSVAGQEGYDLDLDPDPILGYTRRGAPHGRETRLVTDGELSEGKFEVDLPDKLRRVLALESTESKARDTREERLVQGLVFGRRATHYDPDKGGEIWDVGEDDVRENGEEDSGRNTEGEDDWEGEPVPWEVGEL
ncbi:hypothetical protein H0H81_007485 [Sphagnurus paluster]|uniref:DNA replication regulator SLD2 n=1 Tax=Sphagnurus paluster TaxID=117069 RepID=A0A9P7GQ34_9AGAR|nr:hypothetical protein H0H81_007485 [Sphagnurus paluster]